MVKHETGVVSSTILPEKLEGTIQGPGLGESGSICRDVDSKTQEAVGTDAGMICKSFGWISSWSSTMAGAQHGGRASMEYLQAHPDDESVHVVMG
jgi:hypothetical protein